MPGGYWDHPDPAVRLENWRNLAREHIPATVCDHLAASGFPELALDLLRLRGDIS